LWWTAVVQYQDVHPAHRRGRGLRQPVHGLARSHIRDDADRRCRAFGLQRRRRFIQPSLVASADRQRSAFLCQGVRDRAAESFGPAHHERPTVLQSEIHGPLPRLLVGIIGGTLAVRNDRGEGPQLALNRLLRSFGQTVPRQLRALCRQPTVSAVASEADFSRQVTDAGVDGKRLLNSNARSCHYGRWTRHHSGELTECITHLPIFRSVLSQIAMYSSMPHSW
jgi:hypothetical protein